MGTAFRWFRYAQPPATRLNASGIALGILPSSGLRECTQANNTLGISDTENIVSNLPKSAFVVACGFNSRDSRGRMAASRFQPFRRIAALFGLALATGLAAANEPGSWTLLSELPTNDWAGSPRNYSGLPDGSAFVSVDGISPALWRLQPDGSIDPTFSLEPRLGIASQISPLPDGRLLVAGLIYPGSGYDPSYSLIRLLPDGRMDTSFTPLSWGDVSDLWIGFQTLPDGRLLVTGSHDDWATQSPSIPLITLRNEDGTIDPAWVALSPATGPNWRVISCMPDGDGWIVTGKFTHWAGVPVTSPIRITATGTLDSSWDPQLDFEGSVASIQRLSDGRFLVNGAFTAVNGIPRPGMARLEEDFTVDSTFAPGLATVGWPPEPASATISPSPEGDGSFLVSGDFDTFDGHPAVGLVRLTPTGQVDTQFVFAPQGWTAFGRGYSPQGKNLMVMWRRDTESGDRKWMVANIHGGPRDDPRPALAEPLAIPDPLFPGQAFTLTAFARAPSALTYSWFKDGQPLEASPLRPGVEGPRLRWLSVRAEDAGDYTLRLEVAATGEATIVPFRLDVSPYASGPGALDPTWTADPIPSATWDTELLHVTSLDHGGFLVTARSDSLFTFHEYDAEGRALRSWPTQVSSSGGTQIEGVVPLADGTFLLGGYFSYYPAAPHSLLRLLTDGQLDTAYESPITGGVYSILRQADGHILLRGAFTTEAGGPTQPVMRLLADGSLDPTFDPQGWSAGIVYDLRTDEAGRIYLLGAETWGAPVQLLRLLPDGAWDESFTPAEITYSAALRLELDAYGRPVVFGTVTSVQGEPARHLVRFDLNGQWDRGFGPQRSLGPASPVLELVPLPTGGFYAAGDFSVYDGFQLGRLVRLNDEGQLDPTTPLASVQDRVTSWGTLRLGWQNGQVAVWGNISLGPQQTWFRLRESDVRPGPPVLRDASANLTFEPGQSVSMVARFDGSFPVAYRWEKDGVPVPGAWGPQLRIEAAGPDDAGTYTVHATNAEGTASYVVDLMLAPAPCMTVVSTATSGPSAASPSTLKVTLRGAEDASFQWYREGVPIAGATGLELNLDETVRRLGGSFALIVQRPHGEALRVPFTVAPSVVYPGHFEPGWGEQLSLAGIDRLLPDGHGRLWVLGAVRVDGTPPQPVVALSSLGQVRTDFVVSPRLQGRARHLAVLRQGQLLVSGESCCLTLDGQPVSLVRLQANGEIDDSFFSGTATMAGAGAQITRVVELSDGRLLAVGRFSSYASVARQNVVRLLANGAVDLTYNETWANTVELLPAPADTWWAVGTFAKPPEGVRPMRRLDAQGVPLEPAPPPSLRITDVVTVAVGRSDGGVYLGIREQGGGPVLIRRYTPTGVRDDDFSLSRLSETVFALAVDGEDRLLAAGYFDFHDGQPRSLVVRFGPEGEVDVSWRGPVRSSGSGHAPHAIAVPQPGRVVLAAVSWPFVGVPAGEGVRALLVPEVENNRPPEIVGSGAVHTVTRLSPFSIAVPVFAPASAHVQWFRNGELLPGQTLASLRWASFTPSDEGLYHAEVMSGGVTVTTPPVALGISLASGGLGPVPASLPTLFSRPEGGRVVWSAEPTDPLGSETYLWTRDGDPLWQHTGSAVELINLSQSDTGIYRVRITGAAGTTEISLALLVRETPTPQPGNVRGEFGAEWLTQATTVLPRAGGGYWAVERQRQFDAGGRLYQVDENGNPIPWTQPWLDDEHQVTYAVGVDPLGRLYAFHGLFDAGEPRPSLWRLTADGQIDSTFSTDSPVGLGLSPDGTLFGRVYRRVGDDYQSTIVRLQDSGQIDPDFQMPFGALEYPGQLVGLPGGGVMVGGSFSHVFDLPRPALFRLHADGSLDTSFAQQNFTWVSRVWSLPDGRLLVFGHQGTNEVLRRLLASGLPDPSFSEWTAPANTLRSLAFHPDGRIVLATTSTGGSFLVYLLPDGNWEQAHRSAIPLYGLWSMLIREDGHIVIGHAQTVPVAVAYRPGLALLQGAAALPQNREPQFLLFPAPGDRPFREAPLVMPVVASSGLPVTVSVVDGPAVWQAGALYLTGPGQVVLRAEQPGNRVFAPAAPVEHAFWVIENFEGWRRAYFSGAELDDPAISGPAGDADRDGLSNLLAYALGRGPRAAHQSPPLTATTDDSVWTFRYQRPAGLPGVAYGWEISTDSQSWTPETGEVESSDGSTETLRLTVPAGPSHLLVRLRVSQVP